MKYALDMRNGDWDCLPEPMAFDEYGRLIQGQHRLHAVVESNTTQPFMVVWGWARAVYPNLDNGAGRSHGDMLHAEGVPDANNVAAIIRLAINTERVWSGAAPNVQNKGISRKQVEHYYKDNAGIIEPAARMAARVYKQNALRSFSKAQMGAAIVVIAKANGIDAPLRFFAEICDNSLTRSGDPRWALLKWEPKQQMLGGAIQGRAIGVLMKAWNAYATGADVKLLRWSPTEQIAKPKKLRYSTAVAS